MILTVIMANTWETYCRLIHENQYVSYQNRTVQIELTPEQVEKLKPLIVGNDKGEPVHEILRDCWIEPESAQNKGEQL